MIPLFPVKLRLAGTIFAVGIGLLVSGCATIERPREVTANRLEETAHLVEDVKSFGESIGIKPTRALSRTTGEGPPLSMLWVWMQRDGTIALRRPIDIRFTIAFSSEKERLKIEQVYRVDGYSVYYRQGNEFSDPRAMTTVAFAAEPIVRRVIVILHEDLHGDVNFALPWELEEAIVTPLGSLAAREYFRVRGEYENEKNATAAINNERKVSRELSALVVDAENLFAQWPVDDAKEKVLAAMEKFPRYRRQFERQTQGQHGATVLEAKLSHDLAYYRYFDRIAALAEIAPNLKTLIADLKMLPASANHESVERFLQDLALRYPSGAQDRRDH